jgi:hypothetical protein
MVNVETAATAGILKLKMYLIKHIKFTLGPGRTPPGFLLRGTGIKGHRESMSFTISKVLSYNIIFNTTRRATCTQAYMMS